MSNAELDRLRAKHQAFLAEESRRASDLDDLDDLDDLADLTDEIGLVGARRLDPLASHRAALTARLTGQYIRSGALDADVLGDIVPSLQSEVSAAAEDGVSGPRLELVGIGSGSALLYFEPTLGIAPRSSETQGVTARIDAAIGRVLDAHAFLEANGDAAELRERYGEILIGLGRLTAAMSEHDIELGLLWRATSGRQRPAQLSRRGLDHARNIFQRFETSDEILAEGYVYSVSLSGQVVLKKDINKKRSATFNIQMESAQVAQLDLSLGDFAQIQILRTVEKDLTGREFGKREQFMRLVNHQPNMGSLLPDDSDSTTE